MTPTLRRAIAQIEALPEARQDEIAEDLLEALEDAKWEASFARDPEKLRRMAEGARRDHAEGRTVDADSVLG